MINILANHIESGCSGCEDCIPEGEDYAKTTLLYEAIGMAKWVRQGMRYFPDVCCYCGDFATDKDHLLPVNWSGDGMRSLVPTVPSCGPCNGVLGSLPNPNIPYRAEIILDNMQRKHAKLFKVHADPTYPGLEGNLRSAVMGQRYLKLTLLGRVVVLHRKGFLYLTDDEKELVRDQGVAVLAAPDLAE